MRVLVACEFSGRVRDEFIKRGHDAWSCDIIPSENGGPHIQDDVLKHLDEGWDMLIGFPPCTYLCSSGLHWNKRRPERAKLTEEAVEFFLRLWHGPIDKIAIENPVGCMSTRLRKPDCILQPWQFGHPESKATCLWLKNLPLLKPTNILKPQNFTNKGTPRWDNQTPSGQNKLGPSDKRAMERSKTYMGIAQAMGEQWSVIQ